MPIDAALAFAATLFMIDCQLAGGIKPPSLPLLLLKEKFMLRLYRCTATHFARALVAALLPLALPAVAADTAAKHQWQPLFNGKNFDGWNLVLSEDLKGIDPSTVFQIHDGLIHVYQDTTAGVKVPIGFIVSDDSFSWYHLKLQFRWGKKRFAPRTDRARDAGLLYHAGAEKTVWPRSIECQIQERDVGDCFTVHGVQVQTTVDPRQLKAGVHRFLPAKDGGVRDVWGGPSISRVVKSAMHEVEGWNTVEIIVRGSEEAVHIVNGHEVFHATNLKQLDADGKTWIPLMSGRVLLQAEYAELQYRDIQIKPIDGGPFRTPAADSSAKAEATAAQ